MLEEDLLDWDENEGEYVFEYKPSSISIAEIEQSLREQGFDEIETDNYSGKMKFRKRHPRMEATFDYKEEEIRVDFGLELSDMKEVELRYSLYQGHSDFADSLERLWRKQNSPDYIRADEL